MAYTPPPGNSVALNFSGGYVAPAGNEVLIQFGNVLDNYIRTADVIFNSEYESRSIIEAEIIRTFNIELNTEYGSRIVDPLIHINTNNYECQLEVEKLSLQILPDIVTHDILFEDSFPTISIGGNAETDLPFRTSSGNVFNYGGSKSADIHFKAKWGGIEDKDVCTTIAGASPFFTEDTSSKLYWDSMEVFDFHNSIPWGALDIIDIGVSSPWLSFYIEDTTHATRYKGFSLCYIQSTYPYTQPDPLDRLNTILYSGKVSADSTRDFDWHGISNNFSDREHTTNWGPRELFSFCYRSYVPPQQGDFLIFSYPPKNEFYPTVLGRTKQDADEYNAEMIASLELSVSTSLDEYESKGVAEASALAAYEEAFTYYLNIQQLPHSSRPESVESAYGKAEAKRALLLTAIVATKKASDAYESAKSALQNYVPVVSSESDNTILDYKIKLSLSHYSADPRCLTDHNYTGPRDSGGSGGTVVTPPEPPFPPFLVKQVYYVMNTVLVKTLPGNTEVEVKSVSMTIDRDSWLWQLSMTVAKKEYVDLLSPKNGVYQTVEIYINGWRWVFLVESWQENRGFAKGTYSISGRSPSLILGDPICDKKSFTNTDQETGSTIISGILGANPAASGFSVAFSGYVDNQTGFDPNSGADWLISANAFSYTGQTDIQAIQTLAESIGGYVQTHRSFYNYGTGQDYRVLEILPTFKFQPWNWTASYPGISYIQLDNSIIKEIGTSYKKNPDYYGAYIVGESPRANGTTSVFCNVYKDGKGAATTHAPLCSSPLFTTDQIAQEKGRMIIGESGVWSEHSIKIFSLMLSGTAPGLLKVGDMINVTTGATTEWRGLVTSVSIDASVVNTSVFTVSQTISVLQYVGEWNG